MCLVYSPRLAPLWQTLNNFVKCKQNRYTTFESFDNDMTFDIDMTRLDQKKTFDKAKF